jgi:ABC-2 type transport system ATP-binding protein
MEEAERLCDRVGIIDGGRILALDRVEHLVERHGGRSRVTAELAGPPPAGIEVPGRLVDGVLEMEVEQPLQLVAQLNRQGWSFGSLRVDRPDLESVFLALTGRRLRDGDEAGSGR